MEGAIRQLLFDVYIVTHIICVFVHELLAFDPAGIFDLEGRQLSKISPFHNKSQ